MRSKEIFNDKHRERYRLAKECGESTYLEDAAYNALMLAETEIEELREKLHLANVEISSLIDLKPEN